MGIKHQEQWALFLTLIWTYHVSKRTVYLMLLPLRSLVCKRGQLLLILKKGFLTETNFCKISEQVGLVKVWIFLQALNSGQICQTFPLT